MNLLPCPFCGTIPAIKEENPLLPNGATDTLYRIACTLRECGHEGMPWYPLIAAVSAWNRRTAPPEVEALNALIDKLEVYGKPDWPTGVSFAIHMMPGRYETARAAIDAALSTPSPQRRDSIAGEGSMGDGKTNQKNSL